MTGDGAKQAEHPATIRAGDLTSIATADAVNRDFLFRLRCLTLCLLDERFTNEAKEASGLRETREDSVAAPFAGTQTMRPDAIGAVLEREGGEAQGRGG